jgi:hypothetical protein
MYFGETIVNLVLRGNCLSSSKEVIKTFHSMRGNGEGMEEHSAAFKGLMMPSRVLFL